MVSTQNKRKEKIPRKKISGKNRGNAKMEEIFGCCAEEGCDLCNGTLLFSRAVGIESLAFACNRRECV